MPLSHYIFYPTALPFLDLRHNCPPIKTERFAREFYKNSLGTKDVPMYTILSCFYSNSLMAYLAKPFSFFLLIVLFSSLQIQARESKFFSKFTHISTNANNFPVEAPTPSPTLAPTPAPALAPTLAYTESENGYGLEGNAVSNQFTPTKETETTVTDENYLLNEELSAENYETGNQNSNYNNNVHTSNYNNNGYVSDRGYTTVNYNNNGYSDNYNTNCYETEKQGMSETRFMQNKNNEYTSNYNDNSYTSNRGYTANSNNNGYFGNYDTNGYETGKQGMSDTRYYENGKNYYDVNDENNFPSGYYSERQGGTVKNEGYYGNTQNANEFDTMEEYEKQQGYRTNSENYVP